jgi:hypothetical protein
MSAQAETAQALAATLQMLIGAQSSMRAAKNRQRDDDAFAAASEAGKPAWHGRRVA